MAALPKSKTPKKKTVKGAFAEVGLPRLPNVQCVDLSAIQVDGNYQRITNENRVNRYAQNFNAVLCGVLVISKRGNGEMFIVDGNHRRTTLQKLGYKHWHAYILTGLNSEDEARFYESINVDRKNATSAERFKARLHYRDPIAVTIKETVELCHFELDVTNHRRGGRIIHAVTALDSIFSRSNQPGLMQVLKIISSCWDEDEYAATDAITLRGIHMVISYKLWHDRVDVEHLVGRLKVVTVNKLIRKARGYHDSQGGNIVGLFADAVIIENNKRVKKTSKHWLPPRGMAEEE